LGKILEQQYGQNLGAQKCSSVIDAIAPIAAIANDLQEWVDTLPSYLGAISASDLAAPLPTHQSTRQKLSYHFRVVLTLRFLNVRILLHRPVLDRYIESSYISAPDLPANVLLSRLGSHSAYMCFKSAIEVISIVNSLVRSKDPAKALLNAWWFTVYYGKDGHIPILEANFYTKLSTQRLLCSA
jgi:hypothetical protein